VKRLLLLRHAKAVPGGAKIDDHGRALAQRGRTDAPKIGRYIRKRDLVPNLILCSTSKRTSETAELAFADFPEQPVMEFLDALYLAEPETIVSLLRQRARDAGSVCVVGHNPGLEASATLLARDPIARKEKDAFDAIEEKFPTGALAILDFEIRRWRELEPRSGALVEFVRPRDL
jgi:phosphohistidine phosphatase